MKINKLNSLVELFFEKCKENKISTKQPFLKCLKNKNDNFMTWEQVKNSILILSNYLRKNLSSGDRCVFLFCFSS